jgi:hypothetical protein
MATYRITITSCSGSKRSTASSTPSPTSSAPVDSPHLSIFPSPSTSTLPAFVVSSRHSFVRVSRSLRRTRSLHGAKKPNLRPLRSLPCVSVGALHGFFVSPAEIPSAGSSPGTCTSNGAKPKSVSAFVCPALRLAMLIPILYRTIPRPISTKHSPHHHTSLFIINVFSLFARLTAHSYHPVTPLQHSLHSSSSALALPPYLPSYLSPISPCHQCNGARPSRVCSLARCTKQRVIRLKDWIRGYPVMLPEPSTRSRKHDRLQTRRGARTVRVVSVRRNVRMYTPDLVKSAASWATRAPSGVTHAPNPFVQSRDWERVSPPTLKLPPRYADSFKKRMDLPPSFHPHTGVASSNALIASSTTYSGRQPDGLLWPVETCNRGRRAVPEPDRSQVG